MTPSATTLNILIKMFIKCDISIGFPTNYADSNTLLFK